MERKDLIFTEPGDAAHIYGEAKCPHCGATFQNGDILVSDAGLFCPKCKGPVQFPGHTIAFRVT